MSLAAQEQIIRVAEEHLLRHSMDFFFEENPVGYFAGNKHPSEDGRYEYMSISRARPFPNAREARRGRMGQVLVYSRQTASKFHRSRMPRLRCFGVTRFRPRFEPRPPHAEPR